MSMTGFSKTKTNRLPRWGLGQNISLGWEGVVLKTNRLPRWGLGQNLRGILLLGGSALTDCPGGG